MPTKFEDDVPEAAARARAAWIDDLIHLDEERARAEVTQMLLDAMDATEQSPLGDDVCRAFEAFEGKATGPQEAFKDAVEKDRDQLTEAVDIFLRQRPVPEEGMECFPKSAIAKLRAALAASHEARAFAFRGPAT